MSVYVDLGEQCFTFLTSISDITSDFINSLDFLGYDISAKITDSMAGREHKINSRVDPNWAVWSIFTIFLPGILSGIPALIQKSYDKNWPGIFIAASVVLLFPFLLVIQQIRGIINACRKGRNSHHFLDDLAGYVGAEAYFESFPQLVLQVYTICNGYNVTSIQIISIVFSLFSIAKTSVSTDTYMAKYLKDKSATFDQYLVHTIQTLPCYLTTILFRVAAFSLTITFLRHYAILTCLILLAELSIPCYLRIKLIKDRTSIINDSLYIWLTNVGVTNAHGLGTEFKEENKVVAHFIRNSSIITFLHHFTVLIMIMVTAIYNPGLFDHWKNDDFRLKPNHCHFYWAFAMTILMGCYSLNLTMHRAKHMASMDVENAAKINYMKIKSRKAKVEDSSNTNPQNSVQINNGSEKTG